MLKPQRDQHRRPCSRHCRCYTFRKFTPAIMVSGQMVANEAQQLADWYPEICSHVGLASRISECLCSSGCLCN
jgi:hypothetical protein